MTSAPQPIFTMPEPDKSTRPDPIMCPRHHGVWRNPLWVWDMGMPALYRKIVEKEFENPYWTLEPAVCCPVCAAESQWQRDPMIRDLEIKERQFKNMHDAENEAACMRRIYELNEQHRARIARLKREHGIY